MGRSADFCIGTGTAFAITSDGTLLTNHHVVEDIQDSAAFEHWCAKNLGGPAPKGLYIEPKVWVALGGQYFDADVTYIAPEGDFDLALLKIKRSHSPFFRLSTETKLPALSRVYAVGFPGAAMTPFSTYEEFEKAARMAAGEDISRFFSTSDLEITSTSGDVSRCFEKPAQNGAKVAWIQHTASMSEGNSGGPLCLENGVVVGVNTLISKEDGNMKFSFTVHQLRNKLNGKASVLTWK